MATKNQLTLRRKQALTKTSLQTLHATLYFVCLIIFIDVINGLLLITLNT